MKKIAFFTTLLMAPLAFGQVDVPDVVLSAFQKRYPYIEEVSWQKLKANYQATFEDFEINMAQFTPEGKWVKTAILLSEEDLPDIAAEYITDTYDDVELLQIQMIENNQEETSYLVILRIDGEKVKLIFDEEGIVVER